MGPTKPKALSEPPNFFEREPTTSEISLHLNIHHNKKIYVTPKNTFKNLQ